VTAGQPQTVKVSGTRTREAGLDSAVVKDSVGTYGGGSARVLLTTIDDAALLDGCLGSQATRSSHTHSTLISPIRN
jgi:hypothetical protein